MALYRILSISEFRHTDLPEPVVPATRRCGSFAIFPTIASPLISFPIENVSFDSDFLNASESIISRRYTVLTFLFGTSIPTVDILFGIAAILTPVAPRASAISSDKFVSLFSFTPISSSISYLVTVGPCTTFDISALIPKLFIIFSRR